MEQRFEWMLIPQRRLIASSHRHGQPLGATVRLVADALDRDDLTTRFKSQLDRLHDDSSGWLSYLAENETFGASQGIAGGNH